MEEAKLTEHIAARCTPDFKARAQAAAKADGRTLANWVIWVLTKAIEQSEKARG